MSSLRIGLHSFGENAAFKKLPSADVELMPDANLDVEERNSRLLSNLQSIESSTVSEIWSQHFIQQLFPHEVKTFLYELNRIVRDDGIIFLTCPDLLLASQTLLQKGSDYTAWSIGGTDLTPMEIYYGSTHHIRQSNGYFRHRSGFTRDVLLSSLKIMGITALVSATRPETCEILAMGSKAAMNKEQLAERAQKYFS